MATLKDLFKKKDNEAKKVDQKPSQFAKKVSDNTVKETPKVTPAKPAAAKPVSEPKATTTVKTVKAASVLDNEKTVTVTKEVVKEAKIEEKPKKSVEDIANEVIDGKYGNGDERKAKLAEAGYDYAEVQAKVNEILAVKAKNLEQVAKDVINGKYGNGDERKAKLAAAGYDYKEVQAKVNELLK